MMKLRPWMALPVLALAALACGGSEPTPTLFVIPSLTPMPDQAQPEPTTTPEPTPELSGTAVVETAVFDLYELAYINQTNDRLYLLIDTRNNMQDLIALAVDDQEWLDDPNWHATLQDYVDTLHRIQDEHDDSVPPQGFQGAHDMLSAGYADCAAAGDLTIEGVGDLEGGALDAAGELFSSCDDKLEMGDSMIDELTQ
jgi:hypothetical protein